MNFKTHREWKITAGIVFIIFLILIAHYGILGLRVGLGLILFLWLPGWIWSYLLLNEDALEFLDRMILSVAISTTGIPIFMFILNAFGMPTTTWTSLGLVTTISLIGFIFLYFKGKAKHVFKI